MQEDHVEVIAIPVQLLLYLLVTTAGLFLKKNLLFIREVASIVDFVLRAITSKSLF